MLTFVQREVERERVRFSLCEQTLMIRDLGSLLVIRLMGLETIEVGIMPISMTCHEDSCIERRPPNIKRLEHLWKQLHFVRTGNRNLGVYPNPYSHC